MWSDSYRGSPGVISLLRQPPVEAGVALLNNPSSSFHLLEKTPLSVM